MSIHTLQDLCYAYNVADPVREALFALQDRITELEKQLAVQTYAADNYRRLLDESDHAYAELREKLAEPMTEVADRFAHRMALELECVLSDGAYSNKWYKSAIQVLSEYRSAMNAIHEQHSPTFMGEPKV